MGTEISDSIVELKDDMWERDFYAHKRNCYSFKLESLKLYSDVEIPNLTRIGKLNQPRIQHSAIFNGREIMVLGGSDSKEVITEVWDKNFLSSRIIEPSLPGSYRFYPILHMVPYNFPNN